MCVAIENLYILTDPKQARLGATPGRLLASSPHFPALLRRLVEITVRFREPQMSHPLTSRSMSDLTLSALRRLVATQPRARWLLRSPGFELQWSRAGGVWEPAPGEKTLRWILNYIDSVSAPYITPAAKKEARKVRAHLPHPACQHTDREPPLETKLSVPFDPTPRHRSVLLLSNHLRMCTLSVASDAAPHLLALSRPRNELFGTVTIPSTHDPSFRAAPGARSSGRIRRRGRRALRRKPRVARDSLRRH
jgi:hypothetical protein